MKKLILVSVLFLAAVYSAFAKDEYFSVGAAFPFTYHSVEEVDGHPVGKGGSADFQYRSIEDNGYVLLLDLNIGGLSCDSLVKNTENEWPFIDLGILFGAGYDFLKTKDAHFMLSFVAGMNNLYHYCSDSYTSYRLKEENNIFSFEGGLDLTLEMNFAQSIGFFAGVTALGGFGVQSIKYTKDYRDSRKDIEFEDNFWACVLTAIPKIGFSYRF